jgi:hypothetical protein
LLLRRRHERRVYRFQAGRIGAEMPHLRHDAETTIELLARHRCANETLLVIGIETEIVSARLE